MDCYSSSDPAAVNASLLFDLNNDEENLWIRTSQNLSACSPPPPDSQCTVCLQDRVYVVCRTLADAVKLTMETKTQQVNILESGCPELPSDDAPQWLLPVILTFVLLLLLVVYLCCCRRRPLSCDLSGFHEEVKMCLWKQLHSTSDPADKLYD